MSKELIQSESLMSSSKYVLESFLVQLYSWFGISSGLNGKKYIREFFPAIFSKPSAFPFLDSFVTVTSIGATYLMVQKKAECWAVWLLTDTIATYLYFAKGIKFVGIEYLVFCFIAVFGLWNWIQEFKNYPQKV